MKYKIHTLVQILYLARKEFERNLPGLADEDARKRIEPMNCISWIIGHVTCQHQAFFVDWPQERNTDSRYLPYAWGTLLVRCIFHNWCHLGEISSIRQILGHKPTQFVNMYNWAYNGI